MGGRLDSQVCLALGGSAVDGDLMAERPRWPFVREGDRQQTSKHTHAEKNGGILADECFTQEIISHDDLCAEREGAGRTLSEPR